MSDLRIPFVGFERGYFLDIQSFFPTKELIGHKILSAPCNLRCYYCHRRAFLESDYPMVKVNRILDALSTLDFYNTVVVTGGEITLYHEAASKIMELLGRKGITTLFSTNGAFPDRVEKMVRFSDVAKIDIKGTRSQYKRIAGQEIYDSVLRSIAIATERTKVEVKLILHYFTKPDHIDEVLGDIYECTGMPSNLAVEFQPVKDFLRSGFSEPDIDWIMNICANAKPLPAIALLKHYGEKERIYRLSDGRWDVFREKEIPLRFKWAGGGAKKGTT